MSLVHLFTVVQRHYWTRSVYCYCYYRYGVCCACREVNCTWLSQSLDFGLALVSGEPSHMRPARRLSAAYITSLFTAANPLSYLTTPHRHNIPSVFSIDTYNTAAYRTHR